MGYAEIVKADGTSIIFDDGKMIKMSFDWCDKCDNWKHAVGGSYQLGIDSEKLAWFCESCK